MTGSGSEYFFTDSGSNSYKKELEKCHLFISIRFLNSLLSMWELTKRISLRTSSVLSKVEPEPDLYTGSDPKSTGSGSATLLADVSLH